MTWGVRIKALLFEIYIKSLEFGNLRYTAHLRTQVQQTIPGMAFGTRAFEWAVYGPFGHGYACFYVQNEILASCAGSLVHCKGHAILLGATVQPSQSAHKRHLYAWIDLKAPYSCVVYTWALNGLPCHNIGISVSSIPLHITDL